MQRSNNRRRAALRSELISLGLWGFFAFFIFLSLLELLSQGHTGAFEDSKPAGDALRRSLSRSPGMSLLLLCQAPLNATRVHHCLVTQCTSPRSHEIASCKKDRSPSSNAGSCTEGLGFRTGLCHQEHPWTMVQPAIPWIFQPGILPGLEGKLSA